MTKKVREYADRLRTTDDWIDYLRLHSGLPGPRANLELIQAVVEVAAPEFILELVESDEGAAGTPDEFLVFCGVVGLGRLIAEGDASHLPTLRSYASDRRWRVREAVAMALQRVGDADVDRLLRLAAAWSRGAYLEQRAAAAGICEPRLLSDARLERAVFGILNVITTSLTSAPDRRADDYRVLRKGMAYCWSVAVAVYPETGKVEMAQWFDSDDKDVRWVMRQNLRKKRLVRMDAEWVDRARDVLEQRTDPSC